MKLGYIDYLNCYPFYFHMFERQPIGGVELIGGYPSDLNKGMVSSELDMSPISAATLADIQNDALLLPDFCLSSVGYVASVVLRSKIPIEDLDGKVVGITRASHTSVVLLKILLERFYRVKPEYQTTDPNPTLKNLDAVLVIGNEAMLPRAELVSYSYDLGELWLRKTGFPVVFAVFAVREKALAEHEPTIREAIESYRKSLDCLKTDSGTLIAAAKQKYPDIPYDIETYYQLLQFEFTDDLKRAFRYYMDTASEMGLLAKVDNIRYLQI